MKTTDAITFGQEDRSVRLQWTHTEDPRGYISRVIEAGTLEDVLEALADPMPFGDTRRIEADGGQPTAEQLLQSVLWTIQELQDRADRLTVALRDTYQVSWGRLAEIIALGENTHPPKRATAQRRYDSGKRRMGSTGTSALEPFDIGDEVRVRDTGERPAHAGRTGRVIGKTEDGRYLVAGLDGRPLDTYRTAPAFEADDLEPAREIDGESWLDPRRCTCNAPAGGVGGSHDPACAIYAEDDDEEEQHR